MNSLYKFRVATSVSDLYESRVATSVSNLYESRVATISAVCMSDGHKCEQSV